MLTADSARRIAKAVQAYEQNRTNIKAKPLRTMSDDGGSIRWARVAEDWPKDTAVEVDLIYETSCEFEDGGSSDGSSASGTQAVLVWNRLFNIAGGSRVAFTEAVNGCNYVVAVGCVEEFESGSDDPSGNCNCLTIGGEDLKQVTGYDPTSVQVLTHDNGCFRWVGTTECGSS